MSLKKIIMIFYLVYTVYILLICGVTSINIPYILPAIMILWFIFIVFWLGDKKAKRVHIKPIYSWHWSIDIPLWGWAFIIVIGMCSAVISMYFYTGQWPGTVFKNLLTGQSNYYAYQEYYAQTTITTMGFAKLQYVLMLFVMKFIMVFGAIYWLTDCEKIRFKNIVGVLICAMPQFYMALARGTNIEFYEFTIMMVFIILSRTKGELSFKRVSMSVIKPLVLCLLFGICLVTVYCTVLNARGYALNVRISQDITYDVDAWMVRLFPEFAFIVVNLFSYLGYGMYYISAYVQEILLQNPENFFMAFVPKGYELFNGSSIPIIMKETIDMGARWHADFIIGINAFGVIGILAIIYVMGFAVGQIEVEENSIWKRMLKYLVLLQMLSFPVGNFIMCSSASKLLVIFTILMLGGRTDERTAECCGSGI